MTYLIAAAGTGGHVFPGLAVGEALMELGVPRDSIMYVGGDRLEADVYPSNGFRFLSIELAGLQRSLTAKNLRIPAVVYRARRRVEDLIDESDIRAVLGMGGYVTIPVGLAARARRVPFFNAEQNAGAGLANRISARWARVTFTSFSETAGLPGGEWVGNPVRRPFWEFDRSAHQAEARERYDLDTDRPTVGVFGGSLGARAINEAVAEMAVHWDGPSFQMVHLTGPEHLDDLAKRSPAAGVTWRRRAFEDRMELFYAAADLVVARAGGAVAELTATATPSILVPGQFGSGSHQEDNAEVLAKAGAARVVSQDGIGQIGSTLRELLEDPGSLAEMARAAAELAKPGAALSIAHTMIEAAR